MPESAKTTLGALVEITTGFPFASASFTAEPDDIRLVRGDNVAQGGLRWANAARWPRMEPVDRKYHLRVGDVVLAMDRPWIEAGLKRAELRPADVPSYLVQRVARLRAKPGTDQRYIAHIVGSQAFTEYVLAIQTGSAVPHISGSQIASFALTPNPLEDQRAIAEVLGALDDKIAANTRLATLSDELARTVTRRGLSKSVDTVRLGDLITVTKGVSYRSVDLVPSETALVTLKCFSRDGSYAARGLKPYAGDFRAEQVVATGDLAVAQTDLTQAAEVVGRVVSVPPAEEFKTLVASLDLAIVRPKPGVPRGFVLGLLWQDGFRFHCREHTSGTTVLHLARGAIESYLAPLLPAEAMASIAAEVEPLASVAPRIHAENQRLAATRDALLPALLSGKLRVRDAERLAEAHA